MTAKKLEGEGTADRSQQHSGRVVDCDIQVQNPVSGIARCEPSQVP